MLCIEVCIQRPHRGALGLPHILSGFWTSFSESHDNQKACMRDLPSLFKLQGRILRCGSLEENRRPTGETAFSESAE